MASLGWRVIGAAPVQGNGGMGASLASSAAPPARIRRGAACKRRIPQYLGVFEL